MPTSRCDDVGWMHPARLPLGGGWNGHCTAPGHQGCQPTVDELREWCNLGYATACARRPKQNSCDAVRFSVVRDAESQLRIFYACESAHRPAGHGTLDYDATSKKWISFHTDARIQKMAECYLQSYLSHGIAPVTTGRRANRNS